MNKRKSAAAVFAAVMLALVAAWHVVPGAFRPGLIAANRALSGLSEHTVTAAGHEIHYLAGGAGEPVILLHGIFAEKDHWVDFARHLGPGLRVIAPDLPGFGETGRKDGESYDYATQVRRLRELLDALGIARVHLAGSSMGGTIAALFAVQHPERVASVAFIGAPHGIRSLRPSAMDRLIDAGQAPLVVRTAGEFEAMLSLVFARRPFLPGPVLHAARERAIAEAGSDLRIWQVQLADRYLLDAQVARVQQPVLALWGGAEQVFDPSGAEALRARLPAADVQVLPGLGHLPMMEAPAASARAYTAFLERQRARKAASQ